MRKVFVIIAALVLSLVMSITAMGCNLITTDTEKDMNQVVATVQISEDAPKDEILKQDIIMAYLNYGYQLESQSGYTREAAIKYILESLISNRVYLQNAIVKLDEGEGIFAGKVVDSSKDKWDVDRYLTEDDIIEAEYTAKKDLDSLITNYVETPDSEKVGDTYTETVRTVPTGATNATDEELNVKDNKKEMKEFAIDINSTPERKKAYNKVIDLLDVNALLGDDYDTSAVITDSKYYKETLKGYKEQAVIDIYGKCLTNSVHAEVKYSDLVKAYNDKFEEQKKWTDSDFATALSSASATSPILYAPTGTYGFVYNLLLGVSEEQTAELNEWKEENPNATNEQISEKRREIFDTTIVKDLRDTWIMSGYDFDGTKFTGDYALAGNNSLPFNGEVKLLNESEKENEDYKAEYSVTKTNEISLSDFVKMMEEYVYGAEQTEKVYADKSVYKAVEYNGEVSEYEKKINELLFAFSTDPGSLNTYKGYLISPVPDGANAETYMQEFADYGREVVNGNVGKSGYIMVATDYGYHVMFYSTVFNVGAQYQDLADYYTKECKDLEKATAEEYFKYMQENWNDLEDTDNFLYTLYSSLVSTRLDKIVNDDYNEMINTYVYGENSAVVKYEDRYADLLEA